MAVLLHKTALVNFQTTTTVVTLGKHQKTTFYLSEETLLSFPTLMPNVGSQPRLRNALPGPQLVPYQYFGHIRLCFQGWHHIWTEGRPKLLLCRHISFSPRVCPLMRRNPNNHSWKNKQMLQCAKKNWPPSLMNFSPFRTFSQHLSFQQSLCTLDLHHSELH